MTDIMKLRILLMAALSLPMASCLRETGPYRLSSDDFFTVEADAFEGYAESGTKSAEYPDGLAEIGDMNIWAYDTETGLLANGSGLCRTYFGDNAPVSSYVLFPDRNRSYDVFVLANVGKLEAPPHRDGAVSFPYDFTDCGSFAGKGFPMAARYSVSPSDPAQTRILKARRLAARYNVQFRYDSGNDYVFELKSVKVRNSALRIYPHSSESTPGSPAYVASDGDELDIGRLAGGDGQELIVPENINRGVFRTGDDRTPANMTDSRAASYASYLEFNGRMDKNDGTGFNDVTCRYYFGSGRDACVVRNRNVRLVLTLTRSILDNDGWTVTADESYDNGYVVFDPSYLFLLDGSGDFRTETYVGENRNGKVRYSLQYDDERKRKGSFSLFCKTGGTWTPYEHQEVEGPCEWRISSAYDGTEEMDLPVSAKGGYTLLVRTGDRVIDMNYREGLTDQSWDVFAFNGASRERPVTVEITDKSIYGSAQTRKTFTITGDNEPDGDIGSFEFCIGNTLTVDSPPAGIVRTYRISQEEKVTKTFTCEGKPPVSYRLSYPDKGGATVPVSYLAACAEYSMLLMPALGDTILSWDELQFPDTVRAYYGASAVGKFWNSQLECDIRWEDYADDYAGEPRPSQIIETLFSFPDENSFAVKAPDEDVFINYLITFGHPRLSDDCWNSIQVFRPHTASASVLPCGGDVPYCIDNSCGDITNDRRTGNYRISVGSESVRSLLRRTRVASVFDDLPYGAMSVGFDEAGGALSLSLDANANGSTLMSFAFWDVDKAPEYYRLPLDIYLDVALVPHYALCENSGYTGTEWNLGYLGNSFTGASASVSYRSPYYYRTIRGGTYCWSLIPARDDMNVTNSHGFLNNDGKDDLGFRYMVNAGNYNQRELSVLLDNPGHVACTGDEFILSLYSDGSGNRYDESEVVYRAAGPAVPKYTKPYSVYFDRQIVDVLLDTPSRPSLGPDGQKKYHYCCGKGKFNLYLKLPDSLAEIKKDWLSY